MLMLILLILIFVYLFYAYVKNKHGYWEKLGVPCSKPKFFVGNMWEPFTMKKHFGEVCDEVYINFPGYKYVGFYKFLEPALVLRDPELIKNVLIKDFQHFQDNDLEVNPEFDEILSRHPFAMTGTEWKNMRALLSPNFTNAKLRNLVPLLDSVGKKLVEYIDKKVASREAFCIDARELCLKYTTETIANCVFGLEGGAFEEEQSEFIKISNQLACPSLLNGIKAFLLTIKPSLNKYLRVSLYDKNAKQYFLAMIKETIRFRKENKLKINDFLDMMTAIKEANQGFTDVDIMAQAAGFFNDGVDTSGTSLSFILFELASNLKSQERLRTEIDKAFQKRGKLEFDDYQNLPYLDAVINEALRKNSPALSMNRRCTKDYDFPSPKIGSTGVVTIKKGTSILIPVGALQQDEAHFSNAQKFIPERFFDNETFTKVTHMPFSEGPRICLGMKFAALQLKVGVVEIIRNFEVRLNDRTVVPLTLQPFGFIRIASKGIWVTIDRRRL